MSEPTYVTIPQMTAATDAQVDDNILLEVAIPDNGSYLSRKVTRDQLLSDVKEEISQLGGLSDDAKQALLQIASKAVYVDDGGAQYYQDLYDALYPPKPATAITLSDSAISMTAAAQTKQLTATLTPADSTDTVTWNSSDTSVATVSDTGLVTAVAYGTATITATAHTGLTATCSVTIAAATVTSISAVYTQSGTVYNTDSLDSLKTDLVVTASWSDSSTSTVASTDYTLSGSLTVGTSTITVTYSGKTTTFTVTVTEYVDPRTLLNSWDLTQSLTDSVGSVEAALSASATQSSVGVTIVDNASCLKLLNMNSSGSITKNRDYEFDFASIVKDNTLNPARLITFGGNNVTSQGTFGFFYQGGYWKFNVGGTYSTENSETSYTAFSGKTLRIHVDSNGTLTAYIGSSTTPFCTSTGTWNNNFCWLRVGDTNSGAWTTIVTAVRVYDTTGVY